MQILDDILAAKVERQAIREKIAEKGYATISLCFNIPGYPKSNDSIKEAFALVKNDLLNYLIAARIFIKDEPLIRHDEAGDVCFFLLNEDDCKLRLLKDDLEAFESEHSLGRLLDVDLFDRNQQPVSSGKKKRCFLCSHSAIECMREERHSYEELRTHVFQLVELFIARMKKRKWTKRLAELATNSILMEVALPGKPGLVCPEHQGSHTDMNYLTFINSSSAICVYFDELAELGYEWDGACNHQLLRKLRCIGLEMEQCMYRATNGVNTQKGIVFLMGFSLFAAAHVIRVKQVFDMDLFRAVLKKLNRGIVHDELEGKSDKGLTNGEKCFVKFGKELAGGIRQEIEFGLPTVFDVSLPFMQNLFLNGLEVNNQADFQEKLMRTLLKIMSVNMDTNVLHRAGIEVLTKLKALALNACEAENLFENADYFELMDFCIKENISPGGSADLLAVTMFIEQLIRMYK